MLLTSLEKCEDVASTIAKTHGSQLVKLSEDSDVFLAVISSNITRVLYDKSGSLEKLPTDDDNATAQVKCLSALRLHGWLENYQTKLRGANKDIPL